MCSAAQARFYYEMGVRLFSIGNALGYMRTGLQAAAAEFRRQMAAGSPAE